MPYDPGLAQRLGEILEGRPGFEQKKMFGGIGWLLDGHMCVGVYKEWLITEALRVRYRRSADPSG